jgi:hypothetical protein
MTDTIAAFESDDEAFRQEVKAPAIIKGPEP